MGRGLPARIVLHGVEGIGKTSWAANAGDVLVAMVRGETGVETLIDAGQLDAVAHTAELSQWSQVLGLVDQLTVDDHPYKTLVIDSAGPVERLCHEAVCAKHFNGDWTDKGFMGYMRGYEVSLADWLDLLQRLDKLRVERHVRPILIAHTAVKTFKNPEGPDFDRYTVDLHAKTWGLTHKWADMVLFANYFTVVDESGSRAKGKGGTERILYTQRSAAWDAKNRHGLPEEIDMGDSGAEAWGNFVKAIADGRNNGKGAE